MNDRMKDRTPEEKTRRRLLRAAAATGAIGCAQWPLIKFAAAADAEHKMIFAHTFTQATEQYVVSGISRFKELAEKYSEGRLAVDVHEGGKLGGQSELPQKVQYGAIQACQVSMQNFTPFAEIYNILDFPFMFASNEAFERFLGDSVFLGSRLMADPTKRGMHVLRGMWANTGYRVFCTSSRAAREVRIPEDVKGLKVRVTNSKIEQQAFALTPASPVSVAWAETYQAMQQGAADALNVGLGPLTAARLHETLATATRLGMSFNAHITVVSAAWYRKLPDMVREAIDRAAQDSWAYQREEQDRANVRMWEEWRARGIKVIELSPDERARWVAAVGHKRPEWRQWKERYGMALYDQITRIGGTSGA